jgi:hypothetical protein
MNTQISNNVFLQKSKDKYNPDINQKISTLTKARKENIFKKNTIVYNSITNQIPENIISHKDLELQKDSKLNNIDKLILKKEEERKLLDQECKLKNFKKKIIMNDNTNNEVSSSFTEMKQIQSDYVNNRNKQIEQNKNKYDNIINNLKDLGIINN